MQVNRILTNIASSNPTQSKVFYTDLFDFTVNFESDWFVQLVATGGQMELGLIDRNHEIVPQAARIAPQGVYLTLVVEDVDVLYEKAQAQGREVIQAPEDTFYGQRRMLLKDPDGVIVDVSSLMD